MKKIIQIVSFLTLVFVMAGVDAYAQSSTKLDAEIPFDFAIENQTFEAGKYVMRLRRSAGGADSVELRDSNNRVVYEAFAMQNGDTGNGKAQLIFDRDGTIAKLSKVQTGVKGFTIPEGDGAGSNTLALKRKKNAETKN
jgi:hypothetical protein